MHSEKTPVDPDHGGVLHPVEWATHSGVTTEVLASCMALHDLPEPDLLIRTAGEQRISNFLLWQLAYTELYFTDTLWPDFDIPDLEQALAAYASRQRRFGYTDDQIAERSEQA